MTNVIPLKPPTEEEPKIWTCGECGCQTFYLYNDDSTECASCGLHDLSPKGRWIEILVDDETVSDFPTRANVVHGNEEFARKSVLKAATDDSAAVIVMQKDGRIKLWSVVNRLSTEDQQQWLRQSFKAAEALAFGEKPLETDDLPEDAA